MPIFQRADYQSETTQFLQQLKRENPNLERSQREGRALLWDKAVDRKTQGEFAAARVAQKPYVYQTNA